MIKSVTLPLLIPCKSLSLFLITSFDVTNVRHAIDCLVLNFILYLLMLYVRSWRSCRLRRTALRFACKCPRAVRKACKLQSSSSLYQKLRWPWVIEISSTLKCWNNMGTSLNQTYIYMIIYPLHCNILSHPVGVLPSSLVTFGPCARI